MEEISPYLKRNFLEVNTGTDELLGLKTLRLV